MSRRPLPPPAGGDLGSVLRDRYAAEPTTPGAHDTMASGAQEPATPGAQEPTGPRRLGLTTPRAREPVSPRARDATTPRGGRQRPSATAPDTVSSTMRWTREQDRANLQTRIAMQETGSLRRLPDQSEIDRVLWELLGEDAELQRRVLDVLHGTEGQHR